MTVNIIDFVALSHVYTKCSNLISFISFGSRDRSKVSKRIR